MEIIKQNEQNANIAAAKVMRVTIYIFSFVYFLDIIDVFIVPLKAMTVAFILGCILLILPTILIKLSLQEKKWLKYMIVLISVVFVTILVSVFSYHAVPIYIYPIAIASLYFSGSLNIFASVCTIIGTTIGQLISFYLPYVVDDNLQHNFTKLIIFQIIPRAIIVFSVSQIFTMLSKRTT